MQHPLYSQNNKEAQIYIFLSDVCDKLGADKNSVLKSVGSDSRIGNKYFNPGYSFGGPCFPRDTKALKQIVFVQEKIL